MYEKRAVALESLLLSRKLCGFSEGGRESSLCQLELVGNGNGKLLKVCIGRAVFVLSVNI